MRNDLESEKAFAGDPEYARFIGVGPVLEIGPSGTEFNGLATVRIPVKLPEGHPFIAQRELVVFVSHDGGPWEPLYTTREGVGSDFVVEAWTPHLSTFLVGADLSADVLDRARLDEEGRIELFGTQAAKDKRIDLPGAVAIDSQGNIYFGNGAGSTKSRPIVRFKRRVGPVPTYQVSASNPIKDPDGIAIDSTDRVIASAYTRLVIVKSFDEGEKDLPLPVYEGGTQVYFNNINDLAIRRTGKLATDVLYVAENKGQVYRVTGLNSATPQRSLVFNSRGDIVWPPDVAITVDSDGALWVVLRNQGNLYKIPSGGTAANAQLMGNLPGRTNRLTARANQDIFASR